MTDTTAVCGAWIHDNLTCVYKVGHAGPHAFFTVNAGPSASQAPRPTTSPCGVRVHGEIGWLQGPICAAGHCEEYEGMNRQFNALKEVEAEYRAVLTDHPRRYNHDCCFLSSHSPALAAYDALRWRLPMPTPDEVQAEVQAAALPPEAYGLIREARAAETAAANASSVGAQWDAILTAYPFVRRLADAYETFHAKVRERAIYMETDRPQFGSYPACRLCSRSSGNADLPLIHAPECPIKDA